MGDEEAIPAEAKEGYALFVEHACATCHVGKLLGGQSFELMGRASDYFGPRGEAAEADRGRFNVTQKEGDTHKFKVPTLRNIAVTYPYFHDGSTSELSEVVKTMSRVQNGLELSDGEVAKVVTFLETLTGEHEGDLLK